MTGIVVEDGRILLLDQDTDGRRSWSLPGGKGEGGESLEEVLDGGVASYEAAAGRDALSGRGQSVDHADLLMA